MKIIYINLIHSKERDYIMKMQFKKQKITPEKYIALYGANINKKLIDNLIQTGAIINDKRWYNMTYDRAKLAIYLSHTFLWKKIEEGKYPEYNLILEDDVLITNNLLAEINRNIQNVPQDWDIIYIGHSKYLYGKKIAPNIIQPYSGHKPQTNHGMFAYLIKTSSINKLLSKIHPIPVTYNHIDWKIREMFNVDVNAYYLDKPLVMHNHKLRSVRHHFDNTLIHYRKNANKINNIYK